MYYGGISMKSNNLEWCKKQKRGLKIVKPNENIAQVYIKKAESALNMLESAIDKNEVDWIVTTSYYAKYFALYAVFAKCGIKCEIHDCTMTAMKTLFIDQNLMRLELYKDIEESKALRMDLQYYAYKELDRNNVMKLTSTAPDFVLKMQEFLQRFDAKEIEIVRKKLE